MAEYNKRFIEISSRVAHEGPRLEVRPQIYIEFNDQYEKRVLRGFAPTGRRDWQGAVGTLPR
jgi:hypothetical protein